MNNPSILVNGLPPTNNITSLFLSPSFQYGLTIFEGIRCYRHHSGVVTPFMQNPHFTRLERSCSLAGFKEFPSSSRCQSEVSALLDHTKPTDDVYIRFLACHISPGSWHVTSLPDTVCYLYPLKSALFTTPKTVCNFSSFSRISDQSMPPSIKAGANYLNSRYGYLESLQSGSDFPIFFDHLGFVSESSGSCIAIIKDGMLITPPIYSSVLDSITLNVVLELANDPAIHLHVVRRPLTRTDLLLADEIMLVGTHIEIRSVTNLANRVYSTYYTDILKKSFNNLVRGL